MPVVTAGNVAAKPVGHTPLVGGTRGDVAPPAVGVQNVGWTLGIPAKPDVDDSLPSSSNWLTLEDVPPASISIMISKPAVTFGVILALPLKMNRLDELVLSRP